MSLSVCSEFSQQFQRFPNIGLPDRLYGDTPFKELHICNIRVSKNNTIVSLANYEGKVLAINSCGKEGYKNCRKGTNIAGQATAITLAKASFTHRRHVSIVLDHMKCLNWLVLFGLDVSPKGRPNSQSCGSRSWTR